MAIDAVQPIGVHAAMDVAHVLQVVTEVVDAALAEHDVVIQILAQSFPQLHRFFVEVRGFVPQIVGAHDGGVAAGVATANPALFQHRDVGHAVLLGEVVGGRQAMPATADDQRVVFGLSVPGCARQPTSSGDN